MNELISNMVKWRHHLHEYPETAFEERETAAFVADKLREFGYDVHENIGVTGVVASLTVGSGTKAIGLRADMDAINLKEESDLPYKSKHIGKMHACGHDGHTAALLGAAKLLAERRDFNGTVRLIFQPAEEPGKGAHAMIKDRLFERFPMDEIYGVHNYPSIPFGKFCTKPGGFCASEDNFTITIRGRGGHASAPHEGVDPIVIAAQIILNLQTIVSRNVNTMEPIVISCTEVYTDGAHNAIPTTVTIKGDTRSYSRKSQALIEKRMKEICEGICDANQAQCDFVYTHEFAPTINSEECVKAAGMAAAAVVGPENVNITADGMMGSEDFGAFLEEVPGCFLFVGSGKEGSANYPLHNSRANYNDDLLGVCAEFFAGIVRQQLPDTKA